MSCKIMHPTNPPIINIFKIFIGMQIALPLSPMLGLKLATDPRWVNIAEKEIDEILIDHAFCEQKATTNCISLIVRYSEFEDIVEAVSPIVEEEWAHFNVVLKELKKRGYKLGQKRKDHYVNDLIKNKRKGGSLLDQLLEDLLIAAMIEARSCERFRLLSLHVKDEYLKDFYHQFMVSEAGHYVLFLKLAKKHIPEEKVKKRWEELIEEEAKIMASYSKEGNRIHG